MPKASGLTLLFVSSYKKSMPRRYEVDPQGPFIFADEDMASLTPYKRTDAEIAASVIPVNYAYPPASALSAAKRYNVDFTGVIDATTALQNWVNSSEGWMIFPPNGTILLSGQITLPTTGLIVIGNRCTINAPTTGFHIFKCQGGMNYFERLIATRDPIAQNSTWKFINFDGGGYTIQSGSRLIERDCIITGFDIPIYADGTSAHQIDYAEVSACNHLINNLGTGGLASVRPTVNLNNCSKVVIRGNKLDAADTANAVNNIYCIGSTVVTVDDNDLLNGDHVKILSSSGNPVEKLVVINNRMKNGINPITVNADVSPIRHVVIDNNTFDNPAPGAGDVGAVIIAATLGAVIGDAVETVQHTNNKYKGVSRSALYLNFAGVQQFGTLLSANNHYYDIGNVSSGSFAVINQVGTGNYRTFLASNEIVEGNANTRSYTQNALTFTNQQFLNIVEVGLNGTPNGLLKVPLRRQVQTYSASMTINSATGNFFTIDANNGTAFTINAPTNPTDGQRITVKLKNSSGGALGAATWNAVFKMSAWTNPANGQNRSIDFEYDGTNWIQVSQTGIDVPN